MGSRENRVARGVPPSFFGTLFTRKKLRIVELNMILTDVKLNITENESALLKIAEKKLGCKPAYFKILKKSLDARDKRSIKWIYSVEFSRSPKVEEEEKYPQAKVQPRCVLIAGAGPAGLFCAITLLRSGIKPIIVERGKPVEERRKDVEKFFASGELNENSNIQFGEGGAGTFSDGKLNTQTHSLLNVEVLKTFALFGAPQDILYLSKPHIGSDKLYFVVQNMRKYILDNGGKIFFSTALTDIKLSDGKIDGATLSDGRELPVSELVLATGHSSRDTFKMLSDRGIYLEQKEFAVGVRVEHLQKNIGLAQYGESYRLLPAADYKLVSHAGERAAFTFCMCPGGVVIPSASEKGGVAVNGMSNYLRDGANANSALIAQVKKEDFGSDDPLAGIRYQREIERAAYIAGGRDYKAPVQRMGDFLKGRASSSFGEVKPTYARGAAFADIGEILPKVITDSIKAAIPDMDRRLKGFAAEDSLLTGVESRTSSPVRITRGENLQSVTCAGLYPAGEGAGYAGGITSSAADGIRIAQKILEKYI